MKRFCTLALLLVLALAAQAAPEDFTGNPVIDLNVVVSTVENVALQGKNCELDIKIKGKTDRACVAFLKNYQPETGRMTLVNNRLGELVRDETLVKQEPQLFNRAMKSLKESNRFMQFATIYINQK